MRLNLIAQTDDAGRRLDRVLRKALPEIPLSALHRLFRTGRVLVNGLAAGAARRVLSGDALSVLGLEGPSEPEKTPDAARDGTRNEKPKNTGRLDVLFEGGGILVLNKPAGLAVHGPDRDNLAARVFSFLEKKLPPSLSFRPGPLHRIDKPTSGVLVFSTSLEGARRFSRLLKEGKIRKTYLAILEGELKKAEIWEDDLVRDTKRRKSEAASPEQKSGKPESKAKTALTKVIPAAAARPGRGGPALSLALIEIRTGLTHQIRAQAAVHGHPLWGDYKYGGASNKGRKGGFFLHALSLEFPPDSGFLSIINAPLPERFAAVLKNLFGEVPVSKGPLIRYTALLCSRSF